MTLIPRRYPIELETARFRVRSAVAEDASERWVAWAGDAELMQPLNLKPRQISVQQLAHSITAYNNTDHLLFCIFAKEDNQHIGVYLVDCNLSQRVVVSNIVIGDRAWWGKKVVNETRAALLDYFFDQHGMEKALGLPLARNYQAVFNYKQQGWRLEGIMRAQVRSVMDDSRLDQYQFGLLREEWRTLRTAKAQP